MTLTLHWWMLPAAMVVCGVAFVLMTKVEGSYFPWPSWHLGAGLLLILAAIAMAIGGWLS